MVKSGSVSVLFTVDKTGKTGNYHVADPLGYGLDEEAIRAVRLFSDNWLPGLVNDQPVDVEVSHRIIFVVEGHL